ncbi:amidohydrolase [Sporolactobacillus shoreicorticis]|uniref:M20 family metallopeptidase n=1 Tax=Sporolactobacillus shoreicorticis TaxID=1923877 RepID=A0ABW5S415_9BACL|nr:amidohydrolase [Sporolactobacillus shoreicorticis]MCO7124257.1 amidohydrolase [Sporolactobacillus shoreicorticis]
MIDSWVYNRAQVLFPKTVYYRRTLHEYPELSFHEDATADFVADELSKIEGMDVQKGIGLKNAVIGTISGGKGPVVGIRSDIDALPIHEQNDCTYRSQNVGVMHACGHDAHMSIALSVAHLIGEAWKLGNLKGTVRFLFQPAEETTDETGKTGAQYLIETGVLDDLDALFALHMMPQYPLGDVLVPDGYCTANVDEFTVKIQGAGGHGAYPHLGKDPIWMLGSVLQTMQGIVAREISPLEPAVVSVCHVHAGEVQTNNVIPSEVTLGGTFRSYSPDVRQRLVQQFENVLSIVKPLGGTYSLQVNHGEPSVYNHPQLADVLRSVIENQRSDLRILSDTFGLGGEDFAHMAKKVPSAMFFLGCAKDDGIKRDLHAPIFDLDERSLLTGVTVLTGALLNLCSHPERIPSKQEQ